MTTEICTDVSTDHAENIKRSVTTLKIRPTVLRHSRGFETVEELKNKPQEISYKECGTPPSTITPGEESKKPMGIHSSLTTDINKRSHRDIGKINTSALERNSDVRHQTKVEVSLSKKVLITRVLGKIEDVNIT